VSPVERLALALEAAQDTAPENTTPEGDDSEQSAVDTAPPPDADLLSEPLLTRPITRVDPGPVGGLAHSLIRGRHPVVRREGEVRVSASYLRTDNPVTGREDDGRGAFEYGVTDRFTLGAAVGPHTTTRSFALTRGDSLDHLEVSAMYGLAETRRDALSLRLDAVVSERGLADGDDRIEWRPALVGGHRLNPFAEVYGGLGAAVADEPGKTERFTYTSAFAWEVSSRVVGLIEVDGAIGRHSFHEMYLTPAIVFKARKRLQLRAGVPIGVTRDSADYQVALGLAVVF